MLARLEAIDGVTLAEVDHRGELLRLQLMSGQALEDAIQTLRELGYGADRSGDAPAVARWYGRDTVRELSREEGDVIAERVMSTFARSRGIDPSTRAQLEDLVTRALYAYFAAHTLDKSAAPGTLVRECVNVVEAAVRDLLGPDGARELAALLSADLEDAGSTELRSS